uniref:Uncharacterized protein n=1 Tax=Sphaerodactylus townsendi TaxID=933632 RepID=A0ACB8ETE9_9SAUR
MKPAKAQSICNITYTIRLFHQPLDFVGAFHNRWSLAFAFGALANKVMIMFSKRFLPVQVPQWARAVVILVCAVEVGLSSYPFFACLSTRFQITGATLGFLYTASWLAIIMLNIAQCPHGQEEMPFPEVHQVNHVQQLIGKPPRQLQKSWIQRKVYEWDPYFRFPSRMICMAVLALICLYMFVVFEFYFMKSLIQTLYTLEENFEMLVAARNTSEVLVSAVQYFKEFIDFTEGYLIIHIVQWVFGMALVYILILPIKHGQGKEVAKSLGTGILTVAIVIGLLVLQIVTATRFFLQPKILANDKEKPLALDNRKAFHNFNYFFFFYNVLLGLSTCLVRLFCSVLVGTWLIARIDRTIMPKGYEAADMGL